MSQIESRNGAATPKQQDSYRQPTTAAWSPSSQPVVSTKVRFLSITATTESYSIGAKDFRVLKLLPEWWS